MRGLFLVVGLSPAALTGLACGQVPLPDVEAVNERIDELADLAPPEDIYLEYETTSGVSTIRQAERLISQWGPRVKESPESPMAHRVEGAWRVIEHGPPSLTERIWFGGGDGWRISKNLDPSIDLGVTEHNPFMDRAQSRSSDAWRIVGHRFQSLEDRVAAEKQAVLEVLMVWRHFASGGLFVGKLDMRATEVRVRGETWEARLSLPDGSRVRELTGRVLENGVVLPTTRVETVGQYAGQRATYRDWRRIDFLDRWIAGSYAQWNADGDLIHRFELVEIRPLERGELERVTRVPEPGRPDAVRGIRFAAGDADNGDASTAPSDEAATATRSPREGASDHGRRWFTFAGVAAALGIVGTLIWLRRRSS